MKIVIKGFDNGKSRDREYRVGVKTDRDGVEWKLWVEMGYRSGSDIWLRDIDGGYKWEHHLFLPILGIEK